MVENLGIFTTGYNIYLQSDSDPKFKVKAKYSLTPYSIEFKIVCTNGVDEKEATGQVVTQVITCDETLITQALPPQATILRREEGGSPV